MWRTYDMSEIHSNTKYVWRNQIKLGWVFDIYKNAWGVGRNEHGDLSGWGSRIFKADNDPDATGSAGPALKEWKPLHEESDPNIYESYSDMVTIYIWLREQILMVHFVGHVIVKTQMYAIWPILQHLLLEGINHSV